MNHANAGFVRTRAASCERIELEPQEIRHILAACYAQHIDDKCTICLKLTEKFKKVPQGEGGHFLYSR
jgi:hypothetical protein